MTRTVGDVVKCTFCGTHIENEDSAVRVTWPECSAGKPYHTSCWFRAPERTAGLRYIGAGHDGDGWENNTL